MRELKFRAVNDYLDVDCSYCGSPRFLKCRSTSGSECPPHAARKNKSWKARTSEDDQVWIASAQAQSKLNESIERPERTGLLLLLGFISGATVMTFVLHVMA